MKVTIHANHPISNPPGVSTRWNDKVYEYSGDLRNVAELGAWITKQVKITFNYAPGYSRLVNGKCVFFPKRRVTGVHCIWVEECEE